MKFTEKLKSFINRTKDSKDHTNTITADESYIYIESIYNAERNFIFYFCFTPDYNAEAIEFLEAVSQCGDSIHTKFVQANYIEDVDLSEEDEEDFSNKRHDSKETDPYAVHEVAVTHNRNFLLVSTNDSSLVIVYEKIDNITNKFISLISNDIIKNRKSDKYYSLIKDSILNEDDFEDFEYDNVIGLAGYAFKYDDINKILARLPSVFSARDLINMVYVYGIDGGMMNFTIAEVIKYNPSTFGDFSFDDVIKPLKDPVLKKLVKNPTDDVLKNLVGPKYLIYDDESIPGDISDESLDELFRQKYERFNSLLTDDITYEDIDDIIDSSEELEKGE